MLSPPFIGQLTFRGILEPSANKTLRPILWITRPGAYSLGKWYLETEVLETSSTSDEKEGRIRFRYRQEQMLEDSPCLVVCAL